MNPASGVVLYAVLWCIVLFMVLPWGVRPAEQRDLGHEVGAPANPMLVRKMIVTCLLAGVLWVAVWLVVRADIISFRDWAEGGSLFRW